RRRGPVGARYAPSRAGRHRHVGKLRRASGRGGAAPRARARVDHVRAGGGAHALLGADRLARLRRRKRAVGPFLQRRVPDERRRRDAVLRAALVGARLRGRRDRLCDRVDAVLRAARARERRRAAARRDDPHAGGARQRVLLRRGLRDAAGAPGVRARPLVRARHRRGRSRSGDQLAVAGPPVPELPDRTRANVRAHDGARRAVLRRVLRVRVRRCAMIAGALILGPIVIGLLLYAVPRSSANVARVVAAVVAAATFVLALVDPTSDASAHWLARPFDAAFHVGFNGISLWI